MYTLTQCWFTRKHLPARAGRRDREGLYRGTCRHCERPIISWDRSNWHLAQGFNLMQAFQGEDAGHLFLLDTRDEFVMARFPIGHLSSEAEITAYADQLRSEHGVNEPGSTLELRDSRKGKRRVPPRPAATEVSVVPPEPESAPEPLRPAVTDADSLTGLPGRASFEVAFAAETARARLRGQPLSIAIVAIERLDHIRRAHGLDAADMLLCRVAARLAALGQCQSYLSGNRDAEFLLLLPGAGLPLARARLEQARREIVAQTPPAIPGEVPEITCGIAPLSKSGDPRLALRAADEALRLARANGAIIVVADETPDAA